jgi:oxygen-independent coproporphyrinogen III oxidase
VARRQSRPQLIEAALGTTPMLGLYLHIPFCASICGYCNFNRGLFDADLKSRYVGALEREILRAPSFDRPGPRAADTIFFGGGTPSLLEPADVARLIQACRASYELADNAEVTLETNPETVTRARLEQFLASGVNRISFGVQSFDDQELVRLDRAHSASRARDSIRDARLAGFTNLSFDLMLWLPGQTFASWLRTVDEAVALEPDHLSLYLLELYPNAPLKEAMARAPWLQAPDDEAADMYLAGLDRLDQAGFEQYEISNVSRPGARSRHNIKYWQGGDWRGFGCGAHSTVGAWRWHNIAGTTEYIGRVMADAEVHAGLEERSSRARYEEALFTGLRLNDGVDGAAIEARFGQDPWAEFGEAVTGYVEGDLAWRRGSRVGLTRRGMLVANEILTTFV